MKQASLFTFFKKDAPHHNCVNVIPSHPQPAALTSVLPPPLLAAPVPFVAPPLAAPVPFVAASPDSVPALPPVTICSSSPTSSLPSTSSSSSACSTSPASSALLLEPDISEVPDTDDESDDEDGEDDDSLAAPTVSDYERMRQEKILRNQALLQSLGINSAKAQIASVPESAPARPTKRRKMVSAVPLKPVLPTRRSTRVAVSASLATAVDVTVSAADAVGEDDSGVVEGPPTDATLCDDSSVLRYVLSNTAADVTTLPSTESAGCIRGLRLCADEPMGAAQLPAVYSLSFHPSHALLLAAGKGGYVSLFRLQSDTATTARSPDEALLTFKAHGSWVAAAKFLPVESSSSALLILSASNDGTTHQVGCFCAPASHRRLDACF
jgi:hypothetical protein